MIVNKLLLNVLISIMKLGLFLFEEEKVMSESKNVAKRVDIVHVELVKEKSLLYCNRRVRSPQDGAELFREFLGEVDREHFLVMCLNTKNEPTHLNVCHIGSLNASIVHPREVLKPAILSNAASILVCHNHPSGECLNIVS